MINSKFLLFFESFSVSLSRIENQYKTKFVVGGASYHPKKSSKTENRRTDISSVESN